MQFDCGGSVSSAFRKADFDPMAVTHIFISHTHADHICDLPLFIQMIHTAGRESQQYTSLDIYLPGEALEAVREYLNAAYLHSEKLYCQYALHSIPDDDAIELKGVTIMPIRNGHLKGAADLIAKNNWKNKMQCYSFLIRTEDNSLLYSADLGSETDLFPYLKNLDILVIESAHIDVANLLERAASDSVGKVMLTHFEEGFVPDQAMAAAEKLGLKNLVMAQDGMRIAL